MVDLRGSISFGKIKLKKIINKKLRIVKDAIKLMAPGKYFQKSEKSETEQSEVSIPI